MMNVGGLGRQAAWARYRAGGGLARSGHRWHIFARQKSWRAGLRLLRSHFCHFQRRRRRRRSRTPDARSRTGEDLPASRSAASTAEARRLATRHSGACEEAVLGAALRSQPGAPISLDGAILARPPRNAIFLLYIAGVTSRTAGRARLLAEPPNFSRTS